jgi:uncharacterized protein (DUF58 family)
VFPTRRAAACLAAVGVVSAVLAVPFSVPLVAVAALFGLTLADMVAARTPPATSDQSRLPSLARGQPIPFTIRVEHRRGRAWRLRQPVPPGLVVTPAEVHGPELVGTIVGRHRGTHLLPRPVVRVRGPLGLGACDHVLGADREASVLPDLPGARRQAVARRRARSAEEGRRYDRRGLGTEFESVRDYAPDDDIRQVNWMATARVGRAMSNQFRIEANRDLFCVVDAGRLMAAPVGDATRLDVALDAVAATAVAAEEVGDRVGVVAFADSLLRVLAPRRRGAEVAVRAMFDLEPKEVESDYQRAFEVVGGFKRAIVVVFTDLMDEAAARTLLDALPVLTRHHAMLVATCTDLDLRSAVASEPHRPFDVLRASVAAELLSGRERAMRLMRARGAVVVEDSPDRLGATCVAGYLSLKRRAR